MAAITSSKLLVGAWLLCHAQVLVALLQRWSADANLSHGFLVPFVSAWLAFHRGWPKPGPTGLACRLFGAVLILGDILTQVSTAIFPSVVVPGFGLVVGLAGIALVLTGWRGAWGWAPAIGFLVFMLPWPASIHARVAFPLQMGVSEITEALLVTLGVAVSRDGNLLHLSNSTLQVAEACSGIRQLTAFFALGYLATVVLPPPNWRRWTLLVSALPIAVGANVLRVTSIALLTHFGLGAWTEGWLHSTEGLLLVATGAGLYLAEARLLEWLIDSRTQPETPTPTELGSLAVVSPGALLLLAAVFAAAGAGRLGLTQVLSSSTATDHALMQPLADFPNQLGAWVGSQEPIDPKIIRDIKIDDYLCRTYVDPTGERVTLWISYSKRSTDQYHYPTVCMVGGGWTEDRERRRPLHVVADADPAQRLCFHRNAQTQYVTYWYYLMGEDAWDRWMRNGSRLSRAFLRGRRNASLTIEVFSQSQRPDVEKLDTFARLVADQLQTWAPSGTLGSDLGADK